MIVSRIYAITIIILVEIHLRVHVGTWLFSSWSVFQCYIHNYYLPAIQFLFGSSITSNLNFIIQIYPAALFQVRSPAYTRWRLCKQLPEKALPVPCRDPRSPARGAVPQARADGSEQSSPGCAALPFPMLRDHTAVSTLQTQLSWRASFAQDSDQTAWVLRREEDGPK